MDDYTPPSGPPPPKVPAGWLAKWNEQYSEWFYVNIYTKRSQWDKPTEPVYPPTSENLDGAPPGPPPGYDPAAAQPVSDLKTGSSRLSSNNPYGPGPAAVPASPSAPRSSQPDLSEDERYARQLQAEEDARGAAATNSSRGASDSYYQGQPGTGAAGGSSTSYDSQPLPPRDAGGKSKGFLGKLLGKTSSSSRPQNNVPQQYYGGPPPAPQPGYGGYPPQQPYGYGHPPGGYYGGGGGYGGGGYGYGQPPRRSGGMGTGGAAALGVGGGLLGGMLLADAFDGGDGGDGGGYDGGDGGGGGDDGGGGD